MGSGDQGIGQETINKAMEADSILEEYEEFSCEHHNSTCLQLLCPEGAKWSFQISGCLRPVGGVCCTDSEYVFRCFPPASPQQLDIKTHNPGAFDDPGGFDDLGALDDPGAFDDHEVFDDPGAFDD